MKKGQCYEGVVERIDFPNKAIVSVQMEAGNVETAMVKNALPGQKVLFRVTKNRKQKAEGMLLETLERSAAENETCIFPRL